MTNDNAAPMASQSPAYELFMLGLSVYVLVALAVEVALSLSGDAATVLLYADTAICTIFFADFLRSLARAESRSRYMLTWGWIDLLSSIPFVGPARLGRAARVFRVFRLLRGFRSVRNLLEYLLQQRTQTALAAVSLVSMLLVIFASVAVLQFEALAEGANIRSAQDALWWAYVTITTVGYGDRFPVTPEGRVVAGALMTAGVGLFGTFTASVAAWMMAPTGVSQRVETTPQ